MGQLFDSMQNYFKNGSKEQFLKDWEELKHLNETGPDILEIINGYKSTQPLFTLTAEEIMEVKCAIANRIHDLEIMSKYFPSVFVLEGIKVCENLLKRLNDYGKEI